MMMRRCTLAYCHCSSFALLVFLLLCTGVASGHVQLNSSLPQYGSSFVYTTFNRETIMCAQNSSLEAQNSDLPGAMYMCLSPADMTNENIWGRCFRTIPIEFLKSRSFSTAFSFTTLKFKQFNEGQGFTFFISPDNSSLGASGGYLGWLNSTNDGDNNGRNFAIVFDIVRNSSFRDPITSENNSQRVGININTMTSQYSVPVTHLTTYSTVEKTYAWIDYDGDSGTISVRLSQQNRKPCKPLMSKVLSSSLQLERIFKDRMYAGFSSSTGGNLMNSHTTIWDWTFSSSGEATNIYGRHANCGLMVSWTVIATLIISVLSAAVILLILLIFVIHRKKVRKVSQLEEEKEQLLSEIRNLDFGARELEEEKEQLLSELRNLDFGAREFTFQELKEATDGFQLEIGAGGFGTVFKGELSNPGAGETTYVAVKKIKSTQDNEDVKQLVAEVKVIGRLRHKNIVPLLGWCYENKQMLLVYKFIENGDLHTHLFPKSEGANTVPWKKRIKILRGVAAALVFLHEEFECGDSVVHRDVKPRNVMLDAKFNARLGDFGLARQFTRKDQGHLDLSGGMPGTRGYMAPAPEYHMGATSETDTYSFGILALVVATGRKALDEPVAGAGLVKWVRQMHDDGLLKNCGDVRLEKDETFKEVDREGISMERVLKVGLCCCVYEPTKRPSMRQVLSALQAMSPIFSSPTLPLQFPVPLSLAFEPAMSSESERSLSFDGDFSGYRTGYGSENEYHSTNNIIQIEVR